MDASVDVAAILFVSARSAIARCINASILCRIAFKKTLFHSICSCATSSAKRSC
jgi:hypothetical protein